MLAPVDNHRSDLTDLHPGGQVHGHADPGFQTAAFDETEDAGAGLDHSPLVDKSLGDDAVIGGGQGAVIQVVCVHGERRVELCDRGPSRLNLLGARPIR